MKKIGLSLPWDYLSDNIITDDAAALKMIYGQPDNLLHFLKNLDTTHIELRHRQKNISHEEMVNVFRRLTDFNFRITVHGDLLPESKEDSPEFLFPWLDAYQKISTSNEPIMVTLHPVTGDDEQSIDEYNSRTVSTINFLDLAVKKNNLPIRLALENQRSKSKSITGTSFKDIEELWTKINSKDVGICWDMGHCVANNRIDQKEYPLYPGNTFISSTIHTHIHDIGQDGKTHCLFKENIVPLTDYIQSLKNLNYRGVYNLEFSFSRFKNEKDQKEQMKSSILKLRDLL